MIKQTKGKTVVSSGMLCPFQTYLDEEREREREREREEREREERERERERDRDRDRDRDSLYRVSIP